MKISDMIFQFPTSEYKVQDGLCRIRIFVNDQHTYILITDIGSKSNTASITNNIELINQHLLRTGVILENTITIEHYEKSSYKSDAFEFVSFDNGTKWEPTTFDNLKDTLGFETDEFDITTLSIQKHFDEIEKKRFAINPNIDTPIQEHIDIINRREDIKNGMITKNDIKTLVDQGAIEQTIQALIKQDLSVIADIYSNPKEEYICFSEFPVDDGSVDFVLFTGRSRMDVFLIEMKGANYNLINANSYQDFSAKTYQAEQQIRRRLGYITRNYQTFREFVHEIRIKVENGEKKYNSFLGPKGKKLEVDSDKDINFHTVVIGGRSKDDYHESTMRQDFENRISPPIKIESWDSWLKKVQR